MNLHDIQYSYFTFGFVRGISVVMVFYNNADLDMFCDFKTFLTTNLK